MERNEVKAIYMAVDKLMKENSFPGVTYDRLSGSWSDTEVSITLKFRMADKSAEEKYLCSLIGVEKAIGRELLLRGKKYTITGARTRGRYNVVVSRDGKDYKVMSSMVREALND